MDKSAVEYALNFNLAADKYSDISVTAVDKAGNRNVVNIDNILISTNLFSQFYHNKLLFFGSVGGVVVLAGGATTMTVIRRRRGLNNENANE